ncbi:hypothetical protein AVEN_179106-1 [Araneus ventricosus]|uniref:Uncharacterized protein n=1 Tax=Araneus ventricosus TaxID=182803 RepID=A0A4Y2F3J5_ARAVE|nr:hypothetical protein AVEN_179106-1 [Araneus ventricosus]
MFGLESYGIVTWAVNRVRPTGGQNKPQVFTMMLPALVNPSPINTMKRDSTSVWMSEKHWMISYILTGQWIGWSDSKTLPSPSYLESLLWNYM